MALSGTIYGSFSGISSSRVRPYISWSATQSSSGNYSTVTAKLYFQSISDYFGCGTCADTRIVINSQGYNFGNTAFNVAKYTTVFMREKTVDVPHDADGMKTCGIGATGTTNIYWGSFNFSQSVTLDPIIRPTACTTQDATDVGATSALLHGTRTDAGLPRCYHYGFAWGTSSSSQPNMISPVGTGVYETGSYSQTLGGLSRGTTYYYRAWTYNTSYGYSYGAVKSFTTTSAPPSVTTNAVSYIDKFSARFNGNVTSDQGATITERGFCYNTTGNPTIAHNKRTVSGTTGSYYYDQSGLSPNTTYYVKAFATNSKGTSYGSQVSFTTLAAQPEVTSSAVTNLEATTATFNGTVVTDNGSAITERGVAYGPSSNPTTSGNKIVASGTTGSFSVNATGLTPATTYYYRAYAINAYGTSYGGNIQIRTRPGNPSGLSGTTISKSQINLTWTKGVGASTTIIRRATGGYPSSITSGTGVYSGAGTSTNDTGLDAGTTYYYRAWSREGTDNDSSGYSSFMGTTHYGLTNPGNLADEDSTYATAPANDNKIYVQLSKDGGVNWHNELVGELPSSNGTITLGEGSIELWGTTFTGPDMGDSSFRVKITLGSNKTSYQTLKDYGFNIVYPNLLTSIEVVPKGYFDTDTAYLDTVKVRCYYGTSVLPITAGTQAYDTTTDRMAYFDGTNWKQIATTDDL